MSKERQPEDMQPEYDFSGAVRAEYAKRFGSDRKQLLRSAASMDLQTWLAHSLLSFQEFESYLVAYWSLALRQRPTQAGERVAVLIEFLDRKALRDLTRDLTKYTSVDETFFSELRELIRDRNWLVHKSSLSLSPSRLESIASSSAKLTQQLSTFLIERGRREGMDQSEVMERATEAMREWAADRNAA